MNDDASLRIRIDPSDMPDGRRVAVRELDEIKKAAGETERGLKRVDQALGGIGQSAAAGRTMGPLTALDIFPELGQMDARLEQLRQAQQARDAARSAAGRGIGLGQMIAAGLALSGLADAVEAADKRWNFLDSTLGRVVKSLGAVASAAVRLDVGGVAAGLGAAIGEAIVGVSALVDRLTGGMSEADRAMERQQNLSRILAAEGYDVTRKSVEQLEQAYADLLTRRRELRGEIFGGGEKQLAATADAYAQDLLASIRGQSLQGGRLDTVRTLIQGQLDVLERYGVEAPQSLQKVATAFGVVSSSIERLERDQQRLDEQRDRELQAELKRRDRELQAELERQTRARQEAANALDPYGANLIDVEQKQSRLTEAFARGEISALRYARGLGAIDDKLASLEKREFKPIPEEWKKFAEGPFYDSTAPRGWEYGSIPLALPEDTYIDPILDAQGEAIQKQIDFNGQMRDGIELAHSVGAAIGTWNTGLGQTIGALAQVVEMVYALSQQKNVSAGDAAVAGLGIGMAVGAAGQGFGFWEGDRGKGKFGGDLSGDYGDVGAAAGGVIGGIIGSFFLMPAVGAAIGAVLGGLIGGAIKKGADEGIVHIKDAAGQAALEIIKNEGGLGDAAEGIGQSILDSVRNITTMIGGSLEGIADIGIKIRDDVVSVVVDGVKRRFEEVDEAIAWAVTEAMKKSQISGLDSLYAAVLKGSTAGSIEELESDLNVARSILSFEIGEVGMAARDSGAQLDLLRSELLRLVTDADQVKRGLAAINLEELSRWSDQRDAITGRQKTTKEELAERQRDAEIWNAEKALRIAELEFKQQGYIIERDQLQAAMALKMAEFEMNRGWLQGKARFVEAEIGINAGYASAMSGITQVAIDNLNAIIEANGKLIAGLKKIPDIDFKEIRVSTGGFSRSVSAFGGLTDRWERGVEAFAEAVRDSRYSEATSPLSDRDRLLGIFTDFQSLLAQKNAGNVAALEALPSAYNELLGLAASYSGKAGGLGFLGFGDSYLEFFNRIYAQAGDSIAAGRPSRIFDGNVILPDRFYRGQDRQAAISDAHRTESTQEVRSQTKVIVDALGRVEKAVNTRQVVLYDRQRIA